MDTKDPFAQSYQVVLAQQVEYGWFTVWQISELDTIPSGYVRLSEPVTITFKRANADEGVQEALKVIDQMEREARNELNRKLSQFADRRASLLALTHDAGGAE